MIEQEMTFEDILKKEDELLDSMLAAHASLRDSVSEKNWEALNKVTAEMNSLSSEFQKYDLMRDELQSKMTAEALHPYSEKITLLRSKLLKCKIENQAFSKYVNITKDFIQGVIDNAVPQRRSKVYSKDGQIYQPKPQSVVVNQLF